MVASAARGDVPQRIIGVGDAEVAHREREAATGAGRKQRRGRGIGSGRISQMQAKFDGTKRALRKFMEGNTRAVSEDVAAFPFGMAGMPDKFQS